MAVGVGCEDKELLDVAGLVEDGWTLPSFLTSVIDSSLADMFCCSGEGGFIIFPSVAFIGLYTFNTG